MHVRKAHKDCFKLSSAFFLGLQLSAVIFWTKGSPPSSHKQIVKEITTAGCCVRDQRVSRVISRALIRPMNFPKVV